MSNVMLIGPVSKDIIIKGNSRHQSIGGAVFYQSSLLSKIGINTRALITISRKDNELLSKFPEAVNIIPQYVDETLNFENIYPDNNPCNRIQKAMIPHNPIKIDYIKNYINNIDSLLLGPLSPYDIPLKEIKKLSKTNIPIYLGAQGYLRHLNHGMITLKPWKEFEKYIKYIDVLFIDENESTIILGKRQSLRETSRILASYGPEEVIITRARKGSLIYSKKRDNIYKIPAIKPGKIEDPTGLGDTYMAAYAARKLETENPQKCGLFAAAASSLKLENKGAFNKDKKSIEFKLKNFKKRNIKDI